MTKPLINITAASHQSATFAIKKGQTLEVEINATATVEIQRKNGDSWISMETLTVSDGLVANGNMILKIIVSANTGTVNAEIN